MAKRMMLEDKRQAILDIFDKSKSFYKIQELEKIASKKGVIENTVKDVVFGLLADDLISADKIGTTIYYWGNYNKVKHSKMCECLKLSEEIKKAEESISKNKQELKNEQELKPMSEERLDLLKVLEELNQQVEEQAVELQGYTTLGVEEIEDLKKKEEQLVKEINELTDNLFVLQSYVCDKFNLEKKEFNESFGLSHDMDYVE